MKIHVLCPTCNQSILLLGDRLDWCPLCGTAIPEAMRAAISVRTRTLRPLGLTVGMFVSFALGLALFGVALSGKSGEPGPGWSFLAGSWLLLTAWAIWEEFTWSRHLAVGFWALLLFGSGSLGFLLVIILAIGYLYSKPSVYAYYDALAGDPPAPPPPPLPPSPLFRRLPRLPRPEHRRN